METVEISTDEEGFGNEVLYEDIESVSLEDETEEVVSIINASAAELETEAEVETSEKPDTLSILESSKFSRIIP